MQINVCICLCFLEKRKTINFYKNVKISKKLPKFSQFVIKRSLILYLSPLTINGVYGTIYNTIEEI